MCRNNMVILYIFGCGTGGNKKKSGGNIESDAITTSINSTISNIKSNIDRYENLNKGLGKYDSARLRRERSIETMKSDIDILENVKSSKVPSTQYAVSVQSVLGKYGIKSYPLK